jgi:hypothetical protein
MHLSCREICGELVVGVKPSYSSEYFQSAEITNKLTVLSVCGPSETNLIIAFAGSDT